MASAEAMNIEVTVTQVINKRKGLIKISNELYQTDWSTVSKLFLFFRPSHIEFRHWENDTWYSYGTSAHFDELKEGESVPEYLAIFENKDQEIHFREFIKPQ